jgi:hypothetical protein
MVNRGAGAGKPGPARPSPTELFHAAQGYQALGWSLIPIREGSKAPALRRWAPCQERRPSLKPLADWSRRPDVWGWAVVHGAVSGGHALGDFDDLAAYGRWSLDRPGLAERLPTVATPRPGRHVHFRLAAERFADLGDGELRGDRLHYTLLPPTPGYRWLIPPGDFPVRPGPSVWPSPPRGGQG